APWAIDDYGFRAIIAVSFADIFSNNCFKNGLLPVVLDAITVEGLFQAVLANSGYRLRIDLMQQQVSAPNGQVFKFEVDAFRKNCLLNGLDDIGLTLQHVDEIKTFEQARKVRQPWLFT
ncbi:MAG: 3-isopropylmalate dehydratase small subunit, partial [Candidatus Nitrotoga sp.]